MTEFALMRCSDQKRSSMSDQKKKAILENLWLTYYNDVLYHNSVITEEEWEQMQSNIAARLGSTA